MRPGRASRASQESSDEGGGPDEGEGGATGPSADRAREAALHLFPGGGANAVERDSEDGATWEVEVTRADGSRHRAEKERPRSRGAFALMDMSRGP